MKEKKNHFLSFWFELERERERKKKSKLLSSTYGVSSVGIFRAKNESSSTRRGLRMGTETRDFSEDSSEEFGK